MTLPESPATAGSGPSHEAMLEVLREVHDPELGVNIVALGLVRAVTFDAAAGLAEVTMTLTSAACPLGQAIQRTVEWRLRQLPGVRLATVRLIFEPPWSPDAMDDATKALLGVAAPAEA